jgi:chromosome partitioning protein
MMQVITIATLKGGSGKSTLASCLAVHWQLRGRRPVIIDADPQRSIARLAARERVLGGVRVLEEPTIAACDTARELAAKGATVLIDTPGFRSSVTSACARAADLLLIPVKASPLDVDRMLDTVETLISSAGKSKTFRCILTQTSRDSVIAKHVRNELTEAGLPLLQTEMTNRVGYAEAALWGATPTLLNPTSAAAREIACIADELDALGQMKLSA